MAQNDNAPLESRGPPPGIESSDNANQAQTYEAFDGSTTPERRQFAGASSAEQPQRTPRPTLQEGVHSIKANDFMKVHQIPGARESFMTGIGAGAVVGMGRYVVGAKAPRAANWGFGAFVVGSIIQWEYSQVQRRKERAAMARVVEVIDRKQAEKKARAEEAARLKREAEEKERQAQKRWYKFW
ncbi:hypothetical protein GGS21DRAFT_172755 [Xylaria nigripes]|nr:hypothetical protein GGS21DRAFT_172755 [Xylaria nigripes]